MSHGPCDEEIRSALNDLARCFGVREETACPELVSLLRARGAEACVQEIAVRLALPVRIHLSYVPQDFRPGCRERFETTALARTEGSGRGAESITAQVAIPRDLPLFDSPGLRDYPVHVRVSENCHEHPDTFVTVILHELSHVLLASLRHPRKDSEVHTDLVPLLLGFGGVVRRGRKMAVSTINGDRTITRTTTYGYLTDAQFEFACWYVADLLQHHRYARMHLLHLARRVQQNIDQVSRDMANFGEFLRQVGRRQPTRVKREDASRLVELYSLNHCLEWESRLAGIRTNTETAASFARLLDHYTGSAVDRLEQHTLTLESNRAEIAALARAVAGDLALLRRYLGLIYRLRAVLCRAGSWVPRPRSDGGTPQGRRG